MKKDKKERCSKCGQVIKNKRRKPRRSLKRDLKRLHRAMKL